MGVVDVVAGAVAKDGIDEMGLDLRGNAPSGLKPRASAPGVSSMKSQAITSERASGL